MIARARSRRLLGISAAALLAAASLAACGGQAETPASGPSTSSPAAADAFPVTMTHKYGSTEIKAEPKRVVVVGLTEQDTMLALGVVPVATTEWFGEQPGAIWPWAKGRLGPAAVPKVLNNTDGVPFEQVAALRPDLILGLYSGLTQQDYSTLTKIAPTVAQPKDSIDFGISWDDEARAIGQALGKSEQAAALVTEVEAKIAAARTAHPEFAGATALMATVYEGYWVYGRQDVRGRLLTTLGFKTPAGLDAVTGKEFGANLSKERTDLLDVGALVWLVDDYTADQAKLHADPLYGKLPVAARGREVYIQNDELLGSATSFVTPLSLPFLLDELVPQLAEAVDGDPGTKVVRSTAAPAA